MIELILTPFIWAKFVYKAYKEEGFLDMLDFIWYSLFIHKDKK